MNHDSMYSSTTRFSEPWNEYNFTEIENGDTTSICSSETIFSEPWNENGEATYEEIIIPETDAVVKKSLLFRKSSKLWKKIMPRTKGVLKFVADKLDGDKDSDVDSGIDTDFSLSKMIDQSYDDESENFHMLRQRRDSELLKIRQASSAMKFIKSKKDKYSMEKLLLERILLEASVKQKLILDKILHLGYSQVKRRYPECLGRLLISNISIPLKKYKPNKYQDLYALMTIQGEKIKLWDTIEPENDTLQFKQKILFDGLENNFNISVKVFCIKFKKTEFNLTRFKNTNEDILNKICVVSYNDVHTSQKEVTDVYQTSFNCVGEFTITKESLHGGKKISLKGVAESSRLSDDVSIDLKTQGIIVKSDLAMFLTVGKECGSSINWERQWCLLDGLSLKLYNYPIDNHETHIIKLQTGSLLVDTDVRSSRSNTFSLSNGHTKFYFRTDNCAEHKQWVEYVSAILDALRLWETY